jgi:hypothetical protein
MLGQTFKIVLEINGRLDFVPGAMDNIDDHIKYLTHLISHGSYIGVYNEIGDFVSKEEDLEEQGLKAVKLLEAKVHGSDYHRRLLEGTMTKKDGAWEMKSDEEVREFFNGENDSK